MENGLRLRSLLLSAALLTLAGGAGFLVFGPVTLPAPAADTREPSAAEVAEAYGPDGVHALDTFGAEAVFLWKNDRPAFAALADFCREHPKHMSVVAAWKRALPDWAHSGQLLPFLDQVRRLPERRLRVAAHVPAALPLLLADNLPVTQDMLERHGARAWRLLMLVNHQAFPEHLERLAQVVRDDESILDVSERFGPALALLFVPPHGDRGRRHLPAVVRHAWHTMPPQEAAAFLSTNYRAAVDLLDEGRSVADINAAIDRLRALPELVREMALDHTGTLRLLAEEYRGRNPGVLALERCGPEAADLLYGSYAEPALRRPALVVLAGLGLQGLDVLEQFRKHGPFFELLRRANAELLDGNPPLVLDVIARISDAEGNGQELIDRYLRTPNLAGALARDRYPRRPAEELLDFVPGYTAYRTASDYRNGRLVTGGDLTWAALDASDSVLVVKGLLTRAGKSVAKKLGQRLASTSAGKGTRAVARTVKGMRRPTWQTLGRKGLDTANTLKQIDDLRARFGDDPRTWPSEAREELRTLLARTPGLTSALAGEAKLLARHMPLTGALEQASLVGRLVGIEVWAVGSGPLAERQVLRDGAMRTVRPQKLNFAEESNAVGEFAIALLETSGALAPFSPPGKREHPAEQTGLAVSRAAPPAKRQAPSAPQREIVGVAALAWRYADSPWRTGLLLAGALLGALLALPPVRGLLWRPRRPAGPQPLHE
jgi:hypothetical protein